ncbi:hypothetical protein DH2020_015868 [Rehmannia glutinosa]|uniref:Scarecrow-like protein n=1 Tax=Rehmannia glutinosa TaxID=99300 RepID=A0ABR0WUE3_REHGL
MKVPFPANNKPLNCTTINTTTFPATTTTATYEPKSVLDLRRSPSPVAEKPVSNIPATNCDDPLSDHLLINQHLVDWDSLMRDLGLHDDSSTPLNKPISHSDTQIITPAQYSNLPDLPPVNSFDSNQFVPADFGLLSEIPAYSVPPLNQNPNSIISFDGVAGDLNGAGNWNVGFDYVDELIRLAECFETNSVQLGHVILARLNQRLRSPTGKPLQRAAFYFKEALQSLLTGSTRIAHHPANSSDLVQTIKAQKTFSGISPIPLFSSFTANQAVLEALDGSTNVHVIDFDIGLGGHWASFMKELADKAGSRPVLRISALVSEECANESRLIRRI